MTTPTPTPTSMIIDRARNLAPAARAEFLRRHSATDIAAIHAALVGEAKPKTPRPILEKRILAALEAPAADASDVALEEAVDDDDATAPTDAHDAHEEQPAGDNAQAEEDATTAPPARLPPVGTVIVKNDRHGKERARCVVRDDGVEYNGKVYPSISGAAKQAAIDLGLAGNQNGYLFWGIEKPKRTATKRDVAEALEAAFTKYSERVAAALQDAGADERAKVADVVGQHLVAHNELAARTTAV
jgi:hypothetical protein